METKALQAALKKLGHYQGKLDGVIGPMTHAAVDSLLAQDQPKGWQRWGALRRLIAAEQAIYHLDDIDVGVIDGLVGPQTQHARTVWLWRNDAAFKAAGWNPEDWRDTDEPPTVGPLPTKPIWPKQSGVEKFFGARGQNQVTLVLPWPMRIAWDRKKVVKQFSCHEKIERQARQALEEIGNEYDDVLRKRHGLDLFGGCLNVRLMRGSKTQWSMHSWGIAIDFDPERNQLTWGREKAYLARPECEKFWNAWERQGFVSLGRAKNYDFMHVQAAIP